MNRYVTRPTRADDGGDLIMRTTITVYEEAPEAVDTGLLDASGAKLYRVPYRAPIGFKVVRGNR